MPHLVEGLLDVQKSSGTHFLVVNCFRDEPVYPVALLSCRVSGTESELVVGYERGYRSYVLDSFEEEAFKDFGDYG
jgi:hypothetical protein